MILRAILAGIAGLTLGYGIFYFKYKHRNTVDELRRHLKDANKELEILHSDCDELTQQNELLREKVQDLLSHNQEFEHVISELSKYHYQLKKATEKAAELHKFLQEPDPELDAKLDRLTGTNTPEPTNFF